MVKKDKIIDLKFLYIPDNFVIWEFKNVADFIKEFPEKKGKKYLRCDNYLFAFDYEMNLCFRVNLDGDDKK